MINLTRVALSQWQKPGSNSDEMKVMREGSRDGAMIGLGAMATCQDMLAPSQMIEDSFLGVFLASIVPY